MANEIQVIYVDGTLSVRNLGDNFAADYFEFVWPRGGGTPMRVPTLRLIRPKASLWAPNGVIAAALEQQPDPRMKALAGCH